MHLYPLFSPRHFQCGLRVYCNKNMQPSFLQNWNPWCHNIPFVTFGLHKGHQLLNEMPVFMQLDIFEQELISAITNAHNSLQQGVAEQSLEIRRNEPILIEVYCGFSPILHNWSILGFSRDRGRFGYWTSTFICFLQMCSSAYLVYTGLCTVELKPNTSQN